MQDSWPNWALPQEDCNLYDCEESEMNCNLILNECLMLLYLVSDWRVGITEERGQCRRIEGQRFMSSITATCIPTGIVELRV